MDEAATDRSKLLKVALNVDTLPLETPAGYGTLRVGVPPCLQSLMHARVEQL